MRELVTIIHQNREMQDGRIVKGLLLRRADWLYFGECSVEWTRPAHRHGLFTSLRDAIQWRDRWQSILLGTTSDEEQLAMIERGKKVEAALNETTPAKAIAASKPTKRSRR